MKENEPPQHVNHPCSSFLFHLQDGTSIELIPDEVVRAADEEIRGAATSPMSTSSTSSLALKGEGSMYDVGVSSATCEPGCFTAQLDQFQGRIIVRSRPGNILADNRGRRRTETKSPALAQQPQAEKKGITGELGTPSHPLDGTNVTLIDRGVNHVQGSSSLDLLTKDSVALISYDPNDSLRRKSLPSQPIQPFQSPLQGKLSSARLRMLLRMSSTTIKHIPSPVRQARSLSKGRANSIHGSAAAMSTPTPPPTRLHALCNEDQVLFHDLEQALLEDPTAAAKPDDRGWLPLHVLGDNDRLISDPSGRMVATRFALKLMQAYPDALTIPDINGRIPFVPLIHDWCRWVYDNHKEKHASAQTTVSQGIMLVDRLTAGFTSQNQRSSSTSANGSGAAPTLGLMGSTKSFPKAEVWEEVNWCFTMLSLAMDELGGRSGGLHGNSTKDREVRSLLATMLVMAVPALIKTVLLVENEGGDEQKRLLGMSIFRRCLLCPESVGPWVTELLQGMGLPAKRAVDYLALVSQLSPEDYLGSYQTILRDDLKEFYEVRMKLFSAVEALDGVLVSLVVLDEKEIERAASTAVVWQMMGHSLARPFGVGLVLIDLVLHITLMLSFRTDVELSSEEPSALGTVPTQVVLCICSHYIIRKACEAVSLLSLSVGVFSGYLANIWSLLDVSSIILTVSAVSFNKRNPGEYRSGFNAFVIGLLWIKVLGFLKVINKEMATFILAIQQILVDLKFFVLILLVVIFMFGDMFHIAISTKNNGQLCEGPGHTGPTGDFCSPQAVDSYLRVYALLLGDFELDEWRDTKGMTILFVTFTLLGVIILLNVLIAVILDSYERAKMESLLLFGRARVIFVAQHQALESFLRPGSNLFTRLNLSEDRRKCMAVAGGVVRWVVVVSLVATAMYTEVFLVSRTLFYFVNDTSFPTLAFVLFLCVVLTMALWIVISHEIKLLVRRCASPTIVNMVDKFGGLSNRFVQWIGDYLFGLKNSRATIGEDESPDTEEEWIGRIGFLQKSMEQTVARAKHELINEMLALEKRLYEHQCPEDDDDEMDPE